MQERVYYFETEKLEKNALWFAYIWREGEDGSTAPPVMSFHSLSDNDEDVSRQAVEWIKQHGKRAS